MTVFFPQGIGQIAEMLISIKRLQVRSVVLILKIINLHSFLYLFFFQNFLMYEEKNTQVPNRSKADKASNGDRKPIVINDINKSLLIDENETEPLNNLGIVVSNATAKWTDAQTENSLENINLTVKPGRLVAIIGPVGAGKVRAKKTNYSNYLWSIPNI